MTLNSNLNAAQVAAVLAPYGIANIDSFKLLSGGSENSNYQVKTPSGDYVLTVCEQKSLQKSQELVFLLDYLQANNFASSKALKTSDGQSISLWKNKAVILKEFIEGDILDDFADPLLHYLGVEVAKLHSLPAPDYLPRELSYGMQRFDEVKLYAPDSAFYAWLLQTRNYIQGYINADLPKALIHSDIFTNNIIVSENAQRATIMDFEEASYYYRVFDIGMMMVGCCCSAESFSLSKATSLLKGYRATIELKSSEVKALQAFTAYGAAATAFWRHQNFNHLNPDPRMKDHYLAMQQLADQVMAIPAANFIESLGLESV
ncbi:MAG: phosphotransferase [Oceanospirillaceae bacterium]|nr:phosphotransferase [Oceanospirillaceae bacterium]